MRYERFQLSIWLCLAPLICVTLASVPVSGIGATAADLNDELSELFPDEVLAEGTGFQVTRRELDALYIATKSNRAAQGVRIREFQRTIVEGQLLEKLILTKALLARASQDEKERGRIAADGIIAQTIAKEGSEEAFQRQLLASGISLEEFKAQLQEQATIKEVIDREVKQDYVVRDATAKQFYDQNLELFAKPEIVRIQHIYISAVNRETGGALDSVTREQRLNQAKDIAKRAQASEDFGKLVLAFSEDPQSKEAGGEVTLTRGRNDPIFEAAAFSLKKGQISDVVTAGYGYHIIRCLETFPKETEAFEAVKEVIKGRLLEEHIENQLPAFFERVKQESKVRILGDLKPIPQE